ncbi:hypothetical protein Pta02_55210 [Planobispora takensis]|uniref:Uncharacterized protein n=1 Tax=Planobispora takensis TaxID=1367882 RepID=A0A8J3T3D2_9ACTN|nr:hypothetical protein Pta02_55210 [Planobispora takensis]
MTALIPSVSHSFASPIQVIASDGRRYFVKRLEACPNDEARASLAIEFIVSGVGGLIGAPVCPTSLIRIPEELAEWPLNGGVLKAGLAHASLALEHVEERRQALSLRERDDNRRRHVGIYALYDWCFGDDAQWLYDRDDDYSIYSFDHGVYFPPNSGCWRPALLEQSVDVPNELPDGSDGVSLEAVEEIAGALEKISRGALADILCGVPASWPVNDRELEALGWFLERRAPAVAGRVRMLLERRSEVI